LNPEQNYESLFLPTTRENLLEFSNVSEFIGRDRLTDAEEIVGNDITSNGLLLEPQDIMLIEWLANPNDFVVDKDFTTETIDRDYFESNWTEVTPRRNNKTLKTSNLKYNNILKNKL
jgi:hypothetical protein